MSHSNVSWPALRMLVLFFAIGLGLCGFGPNSTLAQEKPFKLVVFGDSLTAGYRLPENAGFTSVLEAELRKSGRKVDVVNASVSGDTASGGLARLDWALGDGADAVLVELGANDMLRGIDPARTEAALDEIIRRIKAKGAKVLLAGMVAAPGMGKAYEQKFNAIYDTLAKKHAVALYPFFLDGVATNKSLNLGDGIHPNEAGVKAIVENIMPAVIKLIDGDKPVR
ncbi:MAG: arylesterase [Beijerinckiaceae bacterium]